MTGKPLAKVPETAAAYARRLLEMILARGNEYPRSYGFEYEFLPHRILHPSDMSDLDLLLRERGYAFSGGTYTREGRQLLFEPGGQIEYLSPPLRAGQSAELGRVLDWIASTNDDIQRSLGIKYVGTPFIPGRCDAPLLLTSDRYRRMHDRFREVDSRGPDMMKGTAAIHMHAAVITADDVESLYGVFCTMSRSGILGMSPARRDIWDRTDSCRCGLPEGVRDRGTVSILRCIVEHALKAVELRSGMVFEDLEDRDFGDFLDHLTTMFTDVRINVKGGTMELRTPDSRPLEDFPEAWRSFVDTCESIT